MSNLWSKTRYTAPIHYLIGNTIREYDISKANINVLRDANIISEERYRYLYNSPKMKRSIIIGKMQGGDKHVTECLKAGIENARRVFIESNNIRDEQILAIRNDAITVIDSRINNLDITGRVKFRLVGDYTSYYRLNNALEFFYKYDIVSRDEILDVKGLGDYATNLHKNYILDFLTELFYSAQIEGIKNAITLLTMVYNNYIHKRLDINYYRELNSMSKFRFNSSTTYAPIYADFLSNYDKSVIDISYNENILRTFNKIFASIYFNNK